MSNLENQYRTNVSRTLKKYGIVPKYFEPSAATSETADVILEYSGARAGCELKFIPSKEKLPIKYHVNIARPWQFEYIAPTDEERQFLKKITQETHVFRAIRRTWRRAPMNRAKDGDWYRSVAKLSAQERREYDNQYFPTVSGEIDGKDIEKFYNERDIYYMNIGTMGFYTLGPSDPLRLNAPRFSDMGSIQWTAQISGASAANYSFIIDIQMSVRQSSLNIAPTDGKSATIIQNNISDELLPDKEEETDS